MSANQTVKNAIIDTIKNPEQGAKYFARPAGSYIKWLKEDFASDAEQEGSAASKLLLEFDWTEVTEYAFEIGAGFGQCRYFKAQLPEDLGAFEAAATLDELTDDELKEVRIVRGPHQIDVVLPGMTLRETGVVHIVIGPSGDDTVVYCWYPGRLTPKWNPADVTVKAV